MLYDISHLWVWLLLTLVLGAAVGWYTYVGGPQQPWFEGTVRKVLIGFGVALLVVLFALLPRRLGFWVETAVLFFIAYGVGCLISAYWRTRQSALASAPVQAPAKAPAQPPAAVDPAPQIMGPVDNEADHSGERPLGYVAPTAGQGDNLQIIKGIGPQNEERLHKLGVWHFSQIAAWSHANVEWVGSYLAFPGRIDREEWVKQATLLSTGKFDQFMAEFDEDFDLADLTKTAKKT